MSSCALRIADLASSVADFILSVNLLTVSSPEELGLAQSPYREFVQCLVGMEVAALWSGRGCCARTLRWAGGHTSRPVIC